MDLDEQIRNMELPSVYVPVHERVVETLTRFAFQERIETLRDRLADKPEMIVQNETADEVHALRATRLLRQARRFIEMSEKSEDEIKPVLLYYGVTQVCGFFLSSICKYDLSKSHGITVKNDHDPHVVVHNTGTFVRLLDVCSLLGVRSQYSKFVWDESTNDFVESSNRLRYQWSRPLRTVIDDFGRIVNMTASNERTATLDHVSYILLLVASHLARYRPEIWKRIVEGQGQDTSVMEYRRVMEEAETFYYKMASAVFAVARGVSPRHILTADGADAITQITMHFPSQSL